MQVISKRRTVLKGMLAGTAGLALPVLAQVAKSSEVSSLGEGFSLITAEGCNVLAFNSSQGVVLVDSGPGTEAVMDAVRNISDKGVSILFNTHYHADQVGSNEEIGKSGATIIAHKKTQLRLSTDYYLPAEERYHRALPKVAQPNQTFYSHGSVEVDDENIQYGHLLEAHTDGDMYVYFPSANILAVGDVVSPERDPELDWYAGAWLGGRADAMDTLLALSNDETVIIPAYGPVMSKAQLQAERDLMAYLNEHINKLVRDGFSAKIMLEEGVLNGLTRTWDDPYKFLYAGYKGMWAHHSKLADNVL